MTERDGRYPVENHQEATGNGQVDWDHWNDSTGQTGEGVYDESFILGPLSLADGDSSRRRWYCFTHVGAPDSMAWESEYEANSRALLALVFDCIYLTLTQTSRSPQRVSR